MSIVKQIKVRVINSTIANAFIRKCHYSGKVVPNSQLHFGAYLNGILHGVMSFGPSMSKKKIQPLVENTGWNEFIELNRMAFDDKLPKNSESRCISIAIRIIKKQAPHIKWIISFSDGCQCGDGTIYRASGFILTGIKKNTGQRIDLKTGEVFAEMTFKAHRPNEIEYWKTLETLKGYQLRYIYFIDKSKIELLTVPQIPFSRIKEMGIGMYKGKCVSGVIGNTSSVQLEDGGSSPTDTLHKPKITGRNRSQNG